MAYRYKCYFVILSIIGSLFFSGDVRAEEGPPSDPVTKQEMVRGPEQHDMRLVSFDPWVVEGEVLGAVAVCTERPADYWELYDKKGDVLAVSWFDRFGIRRTAVDRGIVEEEDKLEGIFVVVLDANPI